MSKNLVRRHGSPYYYVRALVNGRMIRQSTGETEMRKAERVRAQILAAAKDRRWAALDAVRSRGRWSTLGDIAAAYRTAAKMRGLEDRTIKGAIGALYLVASSADRSKPVADLPATVLTRETADAWAAAAIGKNKDDAKKRSVKDTLRIAGSVFAEWVRPSYEGLRIPDVGPFRSAAKKILAKRVHFAPPPDALIEATKAAAHELKDKDPGLWACWLLCYVCAMRLGEAIRARWEDLMPPPVPGGQAAIRIMIAKSGRARNVPIHATHWEAFEALRVAARGRPWILPANTPTGRRVIAGREMALWMRLIGWPRGKGVHTLRKLRGSEWYTKISAESAQTWLGHAHVAITCQYYAAMLERHAPKQIE